MADAKNQTVSREFSVDSILSRLRADGMRITPGRRAILKALFAATGPLSLTDLQAQARKLGGHPDYATVFRLVTVLENLRVVSKVNLQRPCSYFELRDPGKHYDHLVCRDCGKVELLPMPCPLHEAEREISEKYGFRDLTHSLEFFGRCPDCGGGSRRAKRPRQLPDRQRRGGRRKK